MNASNSPPHALVEHALATAQSDGCVAIVDESISTNLRFANNTLTTNGVMRSRRLTVIALVNRPDGVACAVVSKSVADRDDVPAVVRAAEQRAAHNAPAKDAQPLVEQGPAADWDHPPDQTSIAVFDTVAPRLGAAFADARSSGRHLYGFVEHEVTTTYLGSSTGLRLRHVQPQGHIGITGKADRRSGENGPAASAWVGQATRDFTDVDPAALTQQLHRRLTWAARRIDLPAGRYETILPPAAVADLSLFAYATMSARDAYEGQTVFATAGGGTRVGDQLSRHPVTMRSDPAHPGLECAPFLLAHASSSASSVFDNGFPASPTNWIGDGTLTSLMTSRFTGELTGLPVTPPIGNLILEVADAAGDVEDLVARTERGLLLTCLWYIRPVDPQTMLLTGLTRDGVYLIEDGAVVGEVNNFRFNESPVDLLDRFTGAGATVPTFSREFGSGFPRIATPPLRVPDFNYSSVSQAS